MCVLGEVLGRGPLGRSYIVSFPIAVIVGAALAIVGSIAGVTAYQGHPSGDNLKLYSYADK